MNSLKLQGQNSSFYIIADNVNNENDKLQVVAEVKKAVSEHKNFKHNKNGGYSIRPSSERVDKSTQTVDIPDSTPQYPIVRYPKGYGP